MQDSVLLLITPGTVVFLLPFILGPVTRHWSGKALRIGAACLGMVAFLCWGTAFSSVLWGGPDASPNTFLFPLAFAAVFTVLAGEAFIRFRRGVASVES